MSVIAANPAVVESAPAAGAEIKQILIGGVVISIWMTFVLVLGLRHRAGSTGLPGWAVPPYAVSSIALAIAGFGFVWDVSLRTTC